MKKFFKENWFKLLIALVLVLIGIALFYHFVLSASISAVKPEAVVPQNSLESQTKCMDLAERFYAGKGYKNGDGSDYTNHYNSKLNKCFILISYSIVSDDFLGLDLYDAVEGGHYAAYMGHSICDPTTLTLINASPNKCRLDSGHIWYDGNDTRNPADFEVGYQGIAYGPGIGNENTRKQFMDQLQPFMSN